MEQILAVFGIDWKLLLVQGVNFLLLLAALRYFLYRPILDIIGRRQSMAEKAVKDSEEASRVLSVAGEEARQIEKNAREKGRELSLSLEKAAREKEEKILKETLIRQEKLLEEASEEAVQLKEKALRESKQEIAELAVLSAAKILKEQA